jgi:adenosylcobinamide-phosphate synthase
MQILLAVLIDWLFGEPPNEWHPVAWFGEFVQALERRAPHDNPRAELLYGAGITACSVMLAVLPAFVIERICKSRKQNWLAVFVLAIALKITFAWRALIQAGENVQRDLETAQADNARSDLRALVSRDT